MSTQPWLVKMMAAGIFCLITILSYTPVDGSASIGSKLSGEKKLASLRELMKSSVSKDMKGIQAYIVTSIDAHNSEYVQERDKRRQYITGFKGSVGTAVITQDKALLWTDGRYFAEALSEFDPKDAWTLMKDRVSDTPKIEEWLIENLPPNSTVGVDPLYVAESMASTIEKALNKAGHRLVSVENNLIDQLWSENQPAAVFNKIIPQRFEFSGKTSGDKVKFCFEEMKKINASALVFTALDEIAYLLNWRGSDILYSPIFFSYVILHSNKVHIFVQEEKVTQEALKQLADEKVNFDIHPYQDARSYLRKICKQKDFKKVWIASTSSFAYHSECGSVPVIKSLTPVKGMKIMKNENEIKGMRVAHVKDAVGVVKYFAWLEDKLTKNLTVTELEGLEQLEKFRMDQENYMGSSFLTVSASGKHGAIIHYQVTPKTDVPINPRELYLCDTGSQFLEGTTDITRTLHFGQPTEFEKECYTRVFKGHTHLSTTTFPQSTKGHYLDILARKYLWEVGLEYGHGTGHGVGAFMGVHEFPPRISNNPYPEDPGFQPGMIVSNEPGYYENDKFGIRLENVELTIKVDPKYFKGTTQFLKFDTLTVVPYQTKLLDLSMLTDAEIQHLNNYHEKCLKTLRPLLQGPENEQALSWLVRETQPVKK